MEGRTSGVGDHATYAADGHPTNQPIGAARRSGQIAQRADNQADVGHEGDNTPGDERTEEVVVRPFRTDTYRISIAFNAAVIDFKDQRPAGAPDPFADFWG